MNTEKQRQFLIRFCYLALILVIAVFICRYAISALLPFVIAFLVSLLLRPLVRFLNEKCCIQKSIAAVVTVLLALESAMSAAETVSAIEEIVTRVIEEAPENVSQPMGQGSAQETARRAMASSLQETGALDVNFIASELFASDEERISRVSAAMEEAQIEPVVNVESTRIKNAFEKIRLSTDNGVSITLPRAVADDADSFRMINNPDGSISIEIRNIQSVETKI